LLPQKRSAENFIHENNIADNNDGIQAAGAMNNKFCSNEITANTRAGAMLVSSASNIFCGNAFSKNGWGFAFQNSGENSIFNNNFINNTLQVYYTDTLVNLWNSTQAIGGNYWSDNAISDNDSDGIDDIPYTVNPSNIDNYPLAGIFANYTFTWENGEQFMAVISNSSERIFTALLSEGKIALNLTGPAETLGFCRISIYRTLVQELWGDNFSVLVNGIPPSDMKKWEDGLFTYAYFTYPHPSSQVLLIPEFTVKSLLTLILGFTVMATIIMFVMKRKR
jgi:parallel beta-helix repeat protein